MPRPSSVIAQQVAARARGLDMYLTRIERLHATGQLAARDVERAYAGALLEFHAYVERSIERLFVGLLRGSLTPSSGSVRALITVTSAATARSVVLSERAYVDWLPYKRFTVRRAKAFFSRGRPFVGLDTAEISALEDVSLVRNAIAHQSHSALRKFKERFVNGKALPPNQQRPAGYLRGSHTIGQTRMNHLLSRVVGALSNLCS